MTIRRVFFRLHLTAGSVAGAIVLLMSLTGVLLTYERQILAWADRGQLRVDPPSGARRLPVTELLEEVKRQRTETTANATLTLRSDPREPAEIRAGRESVLYVNTYTGSVLEGGSSAVRTFFQKMVAWHRWLGVEGPGRATAKAITGACNLAFLFLILTGAYLWIPRKWSWPAFRPITWFRPASSGKARDFNWHNVFGIWALIPLFLVVLTALPMSYPWANDLVYRMTGSEPPQPPPARTRSESPRRPQPAVAVDLNPLWSHAATHVPGWTSITAPLTPAGRGPLTFTIDSGNGGQPQKRSTLSLDPATGAVVRAETFADASPGRRLRMWSRFVHTGEYYGIVGQTLAGVASAAGVMLVWTGISLALRRFAAWRSRRHSANETCAAETTADLV